MYSEMMTVTRNEAYKREFYRNNPPVVVVDAAREGYSWRAALLLKAGDILIATGLRMKKFARPTTAVFSQETL